MKKRLSNHEFGMVEQHSTANFSTLRFENSACRAGLQTFFEPYSNWGGSGYLPTLKAWRSFTVFSGSEFLFVDGRTCLVLHINSTFDGPFQLITPSRPRCGLGVPIAKKFRAASKVPVEILAFWDFSYGPLLQILTAPCSLEAEALLSRKFSLLSPCFPTIYLIKY